MKREINRTAFLIIFAYIHIEAAFLSVIYTRRSAFNRHLSAFRLSLYESVGCFTVYGIVFKKTDAHESVYFFAIYLFKNGSASEMSTP